MPYLLRPERWRRQPQRPVAADFAHPLARGLRCAVNPAAAPFQRRLAGLSATPFGLGAVLAIDNAFQLPRCPAIQNAPTATVLMLLYAPSAPSGLSGTRLFGTRGTTEGSSNRRGWEVSLDGGSQPDVLIQTFGVGGNRVKSEEAFGSFNGTTDIVGRPLWFAIEVVRTTNTVARCWLRNSEKAQLITSTNSQAYEYDSAALNCIEIGGAMAGQGTDADYRVLQALAYDRVLSDAERGEWYAAPWQVFRPDPARVFFFPAGGANNYNVDVAESASASDSLSAQLAFAPSLSESASAADAISNALTAAATVAETASATDSVSGPATYLRDVSEAGSAADSLTTTATFPRSIGTEAGSASDTVSTGAATYGVDLAEVASAADSISALLNAAVTLAESGSAADTVSSLATLIAQLAESVSATDSYSSALNSTSYNVSISEAASAVESLSAAWQAAVGVTETGSAADGVSAQAAFARALAEAANVLDAVSAAGILAVTITEAGNATDSVSAPTGFGEVPPGRTITIQMANRTITIQLASRTIQVH